MTRAATKAPHPIPAAALDQPSCLVGTVGSGKTYAAKSAVEILLCEGRRVIIVDPTGVWHGLRTKANGSPGFPIVIFGGEQADVPVSPTGEAGTALGTLLAEDKVTQAIVDVSDMTGGERTRFLTAMLERLYVGARVPRHLILDEADEMAPQNPMPEQMRLLGIVDKIVRRGRVRGFRPMMITQRPAVLSKNVLSQIATLVAMRLTSPQDRKAIEGWVKGSADLDEAKAVLASLPSLDVGEGWVWAPREGVLKRTRFPAIATLDTSATPDGGAAATPKRAMAPVDVAALRDAMSIFSTANEAAEIGTRSAGAAEFAAAEQRGYDRGFEAAVKQVAVERRTSVAELKDAVDRFLASVVTSPSSAAAGPASVVQPRKRPKQAWKPTAAPPAIAAASGDLTQGERALITALDVNEANAIGWAAVAIRAGYVASGGGFLSARKALVARGAVEQEGDKVSLTKMVALAKPPSPDRVVALWIGRLPSGAGRLLQVLQNGPATKKQLAEITGYVATGGGFLSAAKKLRTSGLVTVERDTYRLSDAFREACGYGG